MNTSGCSYSSPTKNCEEFQLQCNTDQRIQILDAGYGKVEQSLSSSDSITDYNKDSERLYCKPTDILRPCKWSRSDKQYDSSQRYDLFKTCSWKPSCRPPSIGPDIAHSISHRCVPGTCMLIIFTKLNKIRRSAKLRFKTDMTFLFLGVNLIFDIHNEKRCSKNSDT